MSIDKMRADLDYVLAELDELDRTAEVETRSLTEDEQVRYDAGIEFVESTTAAVEKAIERAAKIEHARSVLESAPATAVRSGSFEAPNVNLNRAIFADDPRDLARVDAADLRSRAFSAIESHSNYEGVTDAHRENATRLVEKYKGRTGADIAKHVVATGSPEYVERFRSFMEDGGTPDPFLARTAMSLTAANGGYLVPQFLDPTIVLTNDGTTNQIRMISGQVSITVDQWDGVTSAGVNAQWLAEATEAADATPTFAAPTITPEKAAAYLFGSYEVLADSGFGEVGVLIADAKDRLEAAAFTTGTGSDQPYGVVTRLSGTGPAVAGTSTGGANAAQLAVGDPYALDNALGPRWRNNASWLAAKSTYNSLRQLSPSGSGSSFWSDLGGGLPSQLIGYNTYQANDMDTTVVSGSSDPVLILGDFRNGYKVVDRVGVSIMYNPMVLGSNRIPTGQAGWFAFWRVGADVITSNAFKTLIL